MDEMLERKIGEKDTKVQGIIQSLDLTVSWTILKLDRVAVMKWRMSFQSF